MPEKRCGHFALEVEEVPVVAAAIVLRVPIRRCALAERMIAIISQTNEGMAVARKLIFTASSLESVQRLEGQTESPIQIDPDKIRVAFGPDLEAIHPAECTIQRCLESCTPSYRMLLEQFGFEAEADRERGEGCQDTSQEIPDALASSNGEPG